MASMSNNNNIAVVESLQETLTNTPVAQWKELIEYTATVANVTDAESIQVFLDELQQRYGELKHLKEDITQSEDERFALILDACEIKPNHKQFALSQFAVGNSYNAPRQLLVVPSGQGKSRIMVGMIMIYLMSGAGNKVHVVFTSEHLMKRDQAEAADILLFVDDADTKVEYHVGIDFPPELGSLVLIDEADTYMLDDPEKFREFSSANVCIGLTATPAMTNMETAVQELLNFKQYSYNMGNGAVDTYEKMAVDSVIDAPDNKTKVQCISDIAKTNPVLVYGSEELLTALKEADINVLIVNDETEHNLLRQLDTPGEDERYVVAMATDLKCMRGIDYRSKDLPLTLVMAKSFLCKRDALQGFNRVGRFTDKGIRARFTDTPILDLA